MSEKPRRAKALNREERRATIMDAAIPLLVQYGRDVTSKQLAKAAGVAEGTLYSVFDDKDEIIHAAIHRHVEATSMVDALRAIPERATLDELVREIVELTQHRTEQIFALVAILGFDARTPEHAKRRPPDNEPVILAITDALLPHRDQLTVPPRQAAQFIRYATFSMTHPLITDGEIVPAAEISALLLHGFAGPAHGGSPPASGARLLEASADVPALQTSARSEKAD
ncbi:AcrR family transcriptional regulator [Agromyces terreus]|uniref:AcrR family transcriptional regulator n=1 Tax=Agromyces terreus TaxID=424795 RepID=A0A9X2KAT9_9MICO|nr:TetR/AcrR family transcriptional regulator [Agromyces terreus]MCP2370688.1 AcrR family transcriptional regulator [Agromyces terreus]